MSIRVYIDMPNAIGDNIKELYAVVEMKDGTRSVSGGNIMVWAKEQTAEDCISRQSIKRKLQEHHDFFIHAYNGFSNMPQNDKSRVDEINNCIAMVVNEPSVTPEKKTGKWIDDEFGSKCSYCDKYTHLDKFDRPMKFMYCSMCGAKMIKPEESEG